MPDAANERKPMFYEIRTEHARPGRSAELARFMDETVVPLHQEHGMQVVGAFTVAGERTEGRDSDDRQHTAGDFVWIRGFDDAADRDRVLRAVHGDPRCEAVVGTLSELSGGTSSTVRLEPTPRSALR